MSRTATRSGVALALSVVLGLAVPAYAGQHPHPGVPDPAQRARQRLSADADGRLRVHTDHGRVTFVGADHGTTIDDPAVDPSMSAVAAARAHLDRYGAALGADARGTSLVGASVRHSIDGTDIVRWQQTVDGVPVVDGQAAVVMRGDRTMTSAEGDLSSATSVPAAQVSEAAARRAASRRTSGRADVTSEGRWILDPAVLGMPSSAGPRGVWRFVVADSSGRTDVMVDDATGRVLLGIPLEETATRVVCDRHDVGWSSSSPEPTCSSGFARAEGDPATGNADVDDAYDFAGETASFFDSLNIDLTALLGQDVTLPGGTTKALESTVNFCYTGTCPSYANAFWNGTGMYYGTGWASADDVVGHEMTHGFTEHNSNLAYWGQPGAINESLSDIMGEIVDHRYGPAGEDNSAWLLGEDSPIGALRSMKDPTLYQQPDTTTSALWSSSPSDSGGVHTNSGVGNKTFYLISQGTSGEPGGTFNAMSFPGIDAGDAALTKSAKLWAAVDEHLISGSDYADLALVLDQECTALRSSAGFTAGDCATVHQAGLATELATERPGVPAPATETCPTGVPRVLFDSASAASHHGFHAGDASVWKDPAYAGTTAPALNHWVGNDAPTTTVTSLVANDAITLPAGQSAYLMFRHKFLLDFEYYQGTYYYYDGGTVAVDDLNDLAGPTTLTTGWANGPSHTLQSPYGTLHAFSGDSIGWWTSKVDLSAYAGDPVKPQFTLSTDGSVGMGGWEIDDVVVYTCDTVATNTTPPSISGTPKVGATLTASPGLWTSGATYSYQWLHDGIAIPGATASTYRPVADDVDRLMSVRVTASVPGIPSGTKDSEQTVPVRPIPVPLVASPTLSGTAKVGMRLIASPGKWAIGATYKYQWYRGTTLVKGATTSDYWLGPADLGSTVKVRITASATHYLDGQAFSASTSRVAVGSMTPVVPTLKGVPRVGSTLTVSTTGWQPYLPAFTYRWYRDGKLIAGRSVTHRLVAADRGHRLQVRVTATATGYTRTSRMSTKSSRIR